MKPREWTNIITVCSFLSQEFFHLPFRWPQRLHVPVTFVAGGPAEAEAVGLWLVSLPSCLPSVRLRASSGRAQPPAMSLPLLTLTTSPCLLCRNAHQQGTLHGEREQSKPRHSTEWHQLVRSPPPLAKSPAKKAASCHEAPPRKPRSHGCLWPRRQHIMDPHSVLSIPATTPLLLQGTLFPLGFLLGGIFHPGFKNHTDQRRYFSLSDFKIQIFETGQWYGFFFFLSKKTAVVLLLH